MSEAIINDVRRGSYVDSVALMRLSQSIVAMEGVQEAALMMGTPANLVIMEEARLLDETGRSASGGDLVIGIRAETIDAASRALDKAKELLNQSASSAEQASAWQPRSLRAAVNAMPSANLALISVPGDFAVDEARKAIRRGLHAMIFSDNVAVEDEVAIKQEARERGLLVMGPDCGTTILNGVPLAFANVVRQGNIGIVGASGTGIQEVSCLIDHLGRGVSHAIGVGGRDLSHDVGGISTLMALDLLAIDSATEHVVLISKPPSEDVAAKVLDCVARSGKPTTICFIGSGALELPENAHQALTLEDAALAAAQASVSDLDAKSHPETAVVGRHGTIRGLFAGGTLCAEAQSVFRAEGEPVHSNAPIPGVLSDAAVTQAHSLIDLGSDEFTQGKPHPMIDPSVRSPALRDAIESGETAAVLLDVVLGYGSHMDPAGEIVAVLREAPSEQRPPIFASVTGTDADPQVRSGQVAKLIGEGVHIAHSNAQAARWALAAHRSVV